MKEEPAVAAAKSSKKKTPATTTTSTSADAKANAEKKKKESPASESKVTPTAAATPVQSLHDWHLCHNMGNYLVNGSSKVCLNDGTELTVYTTTQTGLMLYVKTQELEEKIPMTSADTFFSEEERTPVSSLLSIMLIIDSKPYHAVTINELISQIDSWPKAVNVPKAIEEKYRSLRAALVDLRNKIAKDCLYAVKRREALFKGIIPQTADKRKPRVKKDKEAKEKPKKKAPSAAAAVVADSKKRKAPATDADDTKKESKKAKASTAQEPPAKKQKTVSATPVAKAAAKPAVSVPPTPASPVSVMSTDCD